MNQQFSLSRVIVLAFRKPRSAFRFGRFVVKNYPMLAFIRLRHLRENGVGGRVSIITPTYKRVESLIEAMDSVHRQTYTNWEHIVVSDGYDADVKRAVAVRNDSRVSYHCTGRMNVMGNYQRNVALNFASGEYILYLDDDNIIYEDCLSRMVQGFSGEDIGYVIAPIRYGDGVMVPKLPFRWGEVDLLNFMVRRDLVEKAWGQSMHHCADFFLIEKISRTSKGNYVDHLIGHHR